MFHLSHDLAKGYSLAIFSRLRQAKRDLDQAKQRLETLQQTTQAERVHIEQVQARVAACATALNHWRGWAVPGGSASPMCRASCIPGG